MAPLVLHMQNAVFLMTRFRYDRPGMEAFYENHANNGALKDFDPTHVRVWLSYLIVLTIYNIKLKVIYNGFLNSCIVLYASDKIFKESLC